MMRTHPLEIPEIIFNILKSKSILGINDLAVTSLVCKSWSEQSRRAQWSDIELNTESWVDPHYKILSTQIRKYGSFVRNLTISDCGADRNRFNSLLLLMNNLQAVSVERLMLHVNSSITLRTLGTMQFSRLKYLKLPHISTTSDAPDVVMRICNSASGIQHLELMDCEIDDDNLMFIAESCPNLKSLDLSRNESITFVEIINGYKNALGYRQKNTDICGKIDSLDIKSDLKKSVITTFTSMESNDINYTMSSTKTIIQHNVTINTENTPVYSHQNSVYQQPEWESGHPRQTFSSSCGELSHHCTPFECGPYSKSRILQMQSPFMFLEELSLVFCVGITNNDFKELFWSFHRKRLRSLNLQFTNIEDSGLETLVRALTTPTHESRHYPHPGITSINISYCSKITARGIKALVERCPQLVELEFLSCDQVSADCFRGPIPWACTNLSTLEFTFHPRVLFTKGRWRGEYTESSEQLGASDDTSLHGEGDDSQTQNSLMQHGPTLSQDVDVVQPHNQQQHQLIPVELQKKRCEYENDKEKDRLHEKESVRIDYCAMFKQLGRLTQLQSLHVYNSPGLSCFANTLDITVTAQNEDISVDIPRSPHVSNRSEFFNSGLSLEGVFGTESGSSSSSQRYRSISSDDMFRSMHGNSPRIPQDIIHFGELNGSSSQSCHKLPQPKPVRSKHLNGQITLHPFTHRMGLKALGRLKKLRELTLYERSNITLGRSELLWIGKTFPELSLLHLRGAIESPEDAILYMKGKRPRIQVQICSLFES